MKKILILFLFSIVAGVFLPGLAHGAVMQMTVTINSIQIPERSAMLLKPVNSNLFFLNNGRVVVVKSGSPNAVAIMGAGAPGVFPPWTSSQFSFPYDSTATYTVHLEVLTRPLSGTTCKADCTPVSDANWFRSYYQLLFLDSSSATCGNTPCVGQTTQTGYGNIGFPKTSIFFYVGSTGVVTSSSEYPWWRSPALFTLSPS